MENLKYPKYYQNIKGFSDSTLYIKINDPISFGIVIRKNGTINYDRGVNNYFTETICNEILKSSNAWFVTDKKPKMPKRGKWVKVWRS